MSNRAWIDREDWRISLAEDDRDYGRDGDDDRAEARADRRAYGE